MRPAPLALSGLIVLALAAARPASAGQEAPAAGAARGKTLLVTQACSFCHGTVGQGGGPAGARIGPPSRALAGFVAYVRRPTGSMPAFSETVLSDEALSDIYAYLRSVPPPKAAKDIPLLQKAKGQ